MALKFRIDNEADIPAALKDEYEKRGNVWVLKVEGNDDTDALRRSLDAERVESSKAKAKLKEISDAREQADRDALKSKGDYEALEASWQTKHATEIKAYADREKAREKAVKQSARSEAANKLATEISTAPALMQRFIADRLDVEIVDDAPIIRVLDAKGKPSALSLDDLKREVVATADFAAIVKASGASGGGAGSGGGSAKGNGGAGPKRIQEMTLDERKQFLARDPVAFRQQRDTENASINAS